MMSVKDPFCGFPLNPEETNFKTVFLAKQYFFDSEYCMQNFIHGTKVAYFSMEIGVDSNVPTYSGGLGVLAGDVIRSSADLRLPLVGVTLVSKKGYLKQKISPDGRQLESADEWEPSNFMKQLPETATVKISGRPVKVGAWVYEQESMTGGTVPVLFLTTDVDGNTSEDRGITDFLYGGDDAYRLRQEIVLGIGAINSNLIKTPSITPTKKKNPMVTRYINPILLWSFVRSHERIPEYLFVLSS